MQAAMSEQTRSVDLYSIVDLIALHLLVLALCLYQLQYLFPLYKTYHLREIIYAYLYCRVALRYPFPDHALFKLITVFLTLALLIAMVGAIVLTLRYIPLASKKQNPFLQISRSIQTCNLVTR